MKKLVFAFVAMMAMSFATVATSCQKGAANDTDSVAAQDTTAVQDSAAQDSAAQDSVKADSVK